MQQMDPQFVLTVRYEAVNAMLLNEFLKEHRKVQQLEKAGRSAHCHSGEGERSTRPEQS